MNILASFRICVRAGHGRTNYFHLRHRRSIFSSSIKMSIENFTITSPENPLSPVPFQTIPEFLLHKSKEYIEKGRANYVIDAITKEKMLFKNFDVETKKIASALYKAGLRKDDFIIYMPSQMTKLHIFLTGVWRSNGICRASYPDDDAETLENRIKEAKCKIILCDTNRIEVCKLATKNVDWPVEIITTEKHPEHRSIDDILESEDGTSCPTLEVKGDDPALILCTSGTTGPSKGAVLTQSVLVQHLQYFSRLPLATKNLMFSTASHYSGSLFTLGVLASGNSSIVTGKISKEILCDTVAEMKPGLAFAFPPYLLQLVGSDVRDYDFSSLQMLMTGGAMVTPAIKEALMQLPNVKDLINLYGLSETGIVITNAKVNSEGTESTYTDLPDFAAGRPVPNTSIQIRDVETLEPLGPNVNGEICICNPALFHSYFNKPDATKETFTGKFLRSGDIGYYDNEGFVYVVDRHKEIFKFYNNHISPSEVENVIGLHPLVDEVCVIGVPVLGGDVPRAFVTLKGNETPAGITEEIAAFAHAKLPNYKHLRGGLYVVPELPKGKTGKITRNLVAKMPIPHRQQNLSSQKGSTKISP